MAQLQKENKTLKQVIKPLNRDAGYLGAYRLTNGNLPPNVLHDKYLVETEDWRQLQKNEYYAAWAKEIVVYPETGKTFQKGCDVVDENWVFDKNSMPQVAVGKKKVALFIKEPILTEEGNKVIISAKPEDIVVLNNFLQKNGWGKVDKETGMPLETGDIHELSDKQKRHLRRLDRAGVRPVARGYAFYFFILYSKRDILTDLSRGDALGVASVVVEGQVQQDAKAELKALIKDAKATI